MKMIVNQDIWDKDYKQYKLQCLAENDTTRKLLDKYIPYAKNNEQAFELGCYPGRFLREIGKKNYILNGCDLTPNVETLLPRWLLENNCKVGDIICADYTDCLSQKYDLVASFGFIEHFENYEAVFDQHMEMVKPGGLLVVQFPNFKGRVQTALKHFFDIKNLNQHVIEAMNLNVYKNRLPKNFNIVYSGYYGNFDFWVHDYDQKKKYKEVALHYFLKTKKLWRYIPDNPIWSPFAMLIAQKTLHYES